MITQAELEQEIRETVERVLAGGGVPKANWITHEIVAAHHPVGDVVSDFDQLCDYGHVRNTLRQVIRRYKTRDEDDTDPQILLPGFARLQKAYLVERVCEGELTQVPVPIDDLTQEEILTKVAELRRMADGCHEHADELLRYHEKRLSAATSP